MLVTSSDLFSMVVWAFYFEIKLILKLSAFQSDNDAKYLRKTIPKILQPPRKSSS